ncbi:hypothetical protein BB559_000691 [Furculomyces boomerangus]|uniref:Phosphoadenosine phosphosulphate reductase domain-containing protein n=2 Tax=Harpellales TaxID=61421 RepID=A0A2T9Z4E3_9FUNG|nr:hypothetical protein BB559_000691 [Furculomyces boomerangus]PWA01770.1 hypothetical protein BB558_002119 [Smittium angustum]PWA03095.1 hypothetical protein BB558_000736 [Smittium angustum]
MVDFKPVFDENNNLVISESELEQLNNELENTETIDILKWVTKTFTNVYQETAFGPSGNVIVDMLSTTGAKVPLIFIDTLFHFDETIELSKEISEKYNVDLHVYKPEGCSTRQEFIEKHGEKLWETDEQVYDFIVKSEPGQRAYKELLPSLVITGRRRSQKGDRSNIKILEIIPKTSEEGSIQIVKLNPLAAGDWTFQKVKTYLIAYKVPYNKLLDNGYKSIGDYHSTSPVSENEDERSGRWKGTSKTECGLHKDYFAMKRAFQERTKQSKA